MQYNPFGSSDFSVSVLGFGAGEIGDGSLSEDHVGSIVNQAADAGITLFDTARGYGESERRIGRHLSWRRKDLILSTKVGYGIHGLADWSYDIILAGIHEAMALMRTDYIDIVHLHSCPIEVLQRGEVLHALDQARQQGKIRVAAYSGENEALRFAAESAVLGGLQSSVNVFDQRVIDEVIPGAVKNGKGYIAKRPLGNIPWKYTDQPVGAYLETYWLRMKAMGLDFGSQWTETALRFTAFHTGISSCIAGTTNPVNLMANLAAIEKGPLPNEVVAQIRQAFKTHDQNWTGEV